MMMICYELLRRASRKVNLVSKKSHAGIHCHHINGFTSKYNKSKLHLWETVGEAVPNKKAIPQNGFDYF